VSRSFRAMPNSGGSSPAILVVHEVFGAYKHIKDNPAVADAILRCGRSAHDRVADVTAARTQGDADKKWRDRHSGCRCGLKVNISAYPRDPF
jgi:hypothetical protein